MSVVTRSVDASARDKAKRDAEVMEMAARMIGVLDENSHKSGWDEFAIPGAMDGLNREIGELRRAVTDHEYAERYGNKEGMEVHKKYIEREALDVANRIMFLLKAIKNEREWHRARDEERGGTK